MTDQTPPVPRSKARTRAILAAVGVLAALAVLGVVYGTGGTGKAVPTACKGAAATVARMDPFARGEVAALALSRPTRLAPDLAFDAPDGTRKTLADYRGRTVLLNLWATWCVPCRKEMPALDRLQGKRGGPDFAVLTVNVDTAKLERREAFFKEAGIAHLALNADPSGAALQVMRTEGQALGLPTTVLIDPAGCQLGVLAGPAEWDGADADRLIEAAMSPAAPQG